MVVNQALADVFSAFNLGGGLVPVPIFEADEETLYPGNYYFLHVGAQKNSFLPEQSRNLRPGRISPLTKKPYIWSVKATCEDGDIAMSSAALEGPDLWAEKIIRSQLFMSDALAEALKAFKSGIDWRLKKCRIVPSDQQSTQETKQQKKGDPWPPLQIFQSCAKLTLRLRSLLPE